MKILYWVVGIAGTVIAYETDLFSAYWFGAVIVCGVCFAIAEHFIRQCE